MTFICIAGFMMTTTSTSPMMICSVRMKFGVSSDVFELGCKKMNQTGVGWSS